MMMLMGRGELLLLVVCATLTQGTTETVNITGYMTTGTPGCAKEEFQCNTSGICIAHIFICNESPDCEDGSDENPDTCSTVQPSGGGSGESGQDISFEDDDGSMETASSGEDECKLNEFQCIKSGKCIKKSQKCDGIADCNDESDETPELCSPPQTTSETSLASELQFTMLELTSEPFPKLFNLQDIGSQPDLDIEVQPIPKPNTEPSTFYASSVTGKTTTTTSAVMVTTAHGITDTPVVTCVEDQYTCKTATQCIPLAYLCDDTVDCNDGSDEGPVYCSVVALNSLKIYATTPDQATNMEIDTSEPDSPVVTCVGHEYKCKTATQCIPLAYLCDDTVDCNDGSDEGPVYCSVVALNSLKTFATTPDQATNMEIDTLEPDSSIITCKKEEYKCETPTKCIPLARLCDDTSDCDDGSDEGPMYCPMKDQNKLEKTFPDHKINETAIIKTGCLDMEMRRVSVLNCREALEQATNETDGDSCQDRLQQLSNCIRPLVEDCELLEELASELKFNTTCNQTSTDEDELPPLYPHIITAGNRHKIHKKGKQPSPDVVQHLISVRLLGDEFTLRLLRSRADLEREVTAQLLQGLQDVYHNLILMVKIEDFRPSSNHVWVDFYAFMKKGGALPVDRDSVVTELAQWLTYHKLGRLDADMGAIVDGSVKKAESENKMGTFDKNTVVTMAICFTVFLMFMLLLVFILYYRNRNLRRNAAGQKVIGDSEDPGQLLFYHSNDQRRDPSPSSPDSNLQPSGGLLWHVNRTLTSQFPGFNTEPRRPRGAMVSSNTDPCLGRLGRGSLIPRAHVSSPHRQQQQPQNGRFTPKTTVWTSNENGSYTNYIPRW